MGENAVKEKACNISRENRTNNIIDLCWLFVL